MKDLLRAYFTFTKKERIGVMVLLVLILITSVAFYFIPDSPSLAKPDVALLQQQLATIDSSAALEKKQRPYHASSYEDDGPEEAPELFSFDPNTLSAAGWERLGIKPRTAQTIQRYIAKGGKFRQPEDLRKIYGLRAAECDRLIPYVWIAAAEPATARFNEGVRAVDTARQYVSRPAYPKPATIDINTADTAAFIALPGIGSKLAGRIVRFREKLGGFYRVEQVGETYGLPDSTFQLVRQWLQCDDPSVTTLNINTVEVATLQQHPYIRWQAANAIVQYRQQHGRFQSVDQLLQINIITPEMLAKMAPYLRANEE
jgi:competence ComEA-like helix-hairpin-helix protein